MEELLGSSNGFLPPMHQHVRSLARMNRRLVKEEVADNKQIEEPKQDLFDKARDGDGEKHSSNDAFKADTENELEAEENELRQQQLSENEEEANNKNNAMEEDSATSIFTFDADRYRDVVEKAQAKTLKGGGADKKDEKDEKEKTDKGKELKANDENTAKEENTPKETDKKDKGKKDGATLFGTRYEDNLETTALDLQDPNDEEPEEASSHPAILESDEAPDDTAELEIAAEDTVKEKAVDEMMTSTTTNPPAAAEESKLKSNPGNENLVHPKPNFESTSMNSASIVQGDPAAQNQEDLLGMTMRDKIGFVLGSISLFALIIVAAATIRRRRRRQTQFQNMKDLSSYLDLGDDPSDDGSTDYALPLYITTPTAAKYAKTDSESGESYDDNDDNYEDDDISALPTYIAKYSTATSPTTTGANSYDAKHPPANDKAGIRELDNIVADICFEAADTKQEGTTSDSIWDHSSAPTLDTTDSVLENLPAPAKTHETTGSSSWENFPSCAVWS